MDYEPKTFAEFIGQTSIKRELKAMLAAKDNSNIIIRGNYGGGKTTLAKIYAAERGGYVYYDVPETTKFPERYVHNGIECKTYIIDEIHLADKFEYLYDQMGKHSFVFCTTEREALPAPFVSRCVELILSDYNDKQLYEILFQRMKSDGLSFAIESLELIASRSRGTPRIAIQLMKRIANLAKLDNKYPSESYTESVLNSLKVYGNGLIEDDVYYLNMLDVADCPVSLNSLSAGINRNKSYVEQSLEPFLLSRQYIAVTPRGRKITIEGKKAVNEIYQLENFKEKI